MDNNWGGKRKGAGRKKLQEDLKKKSYTFQLTNEELSFIESFGGSNRSESLRNLIDKYKKLEKPN